MMRGKYNLWLICLLVAFACFSAEGKDKDSKKIKDTYHTLVNGEVSGRGGNTIVVAGSGAYL